MAIIDPQTYLISKRIPVGNDPHEIIASEDGKHAYVSITYRGDTPHEIDVIDLDEKKRLEDINISPFGQPHGLAFADGNLYFTAEASRAIGRYNPSINKVDWTMGTGQDRTHMIYVTDDGNKIYTTNMGSATISVFDAQNAWSQTIIPLSKNAEGFDVSPDGKALWAAAAEDGSVFIVDLNTNKVKGTAKVKTPGANRLKFTPDGNLVLVSSLSTGELTVINAKNGELVKTVLRGTGCAGILPDLDSKKAFVACTPDNYIAVIDLQTFEVTHKIELAGPDGLAWAVR